MFFVETASLEEIKNQIESTIGWDDFREFIREEGYGNSEISEKIGCKVEFLSAARLSDHESYEWRWKMGSRIFGIGGYYNSWDSNEMDSISGFYELVERTKTITVLERKDS